MANVNMEAIGGGTMYCIQYKMNLFASLVRF